MHFKNQTLLSSLGPLSEREFQWMESFLEGAKPNWGRVEFRKALEEYFDRILALVRSSPELDDLR
jgi:hypothetical protein